MSTRTDVPPDTVGVELAEEGVAVEYLDGREVLYHGVPERVEESVTTPPGKQVHVLVTDPSETQGVLVYVNDRNTHEDVFADTGVGRVILEDGESDQLFPGVTVTSEAYRVTVDVDHDALDGRVFVFAEDELAEESFEVVPAT